MPSEVTIKLLQRAIMENENDKFLIDGFPRNEENRAAFESVVSLCVAYTCMCNYSTYSYIFCCFPYIMACIAFNMRYLQYSKTQEYII